MMQSGLRTTALRVPALVMSTTTRVSVTTSMTMISKSPFPITSGHLHLATPQGPHSSSDSFLSPMLTYCAHHHIYLLTKPNLHVNLNATRGSPDLPDRDKSVCQVLHPANLINDVSCPSGPHSPHHLHCFCLGLPLLLPRL